MADPTKYIVDYSFTDFQTGTPSRPLPAPELDVELANIENSIDEIVEAIKDVRRSDGAIQNDSVTLDSLNDEVFLGFAGLTANLVIPTGDWAPTTAYLKGSIVSVNGGSAMAKEPHTSGANYNTDFAAGKWQTLATKGASGTGTGDMVAAQNLSDLVSVPTARTNLGLGSIATQASSNVTITGGSIAGITDLAIADGGTGASTAPQALINFGLTATAAEINGALDGVTATAAEINAATNFALVTQGTFSGSEIIIDIPDDLEAVEIQYWGFTPSTNGTVLKLAVGSGTVFSPTFGGNHYQQIQAVVGTTYTPSATGPAASVDLSTAQLTAGSPSSGRVTINGFHASGSVYGEVATRGVLSTGPQRVSAHGMFTEETTVVHTLIRLFVSAGTMAGTYRITGYRKP
jgi:hypothetical protein